MDSLYVGEIKQFGPAPNSLSESKRGRERNPQEISNTVVQEIANKHILEVLNSDGTRTEACISKCLQGEKSILDEPGFSQLNVPPLPPLPLSDVECTQLARLLKQAPISVHRQTLLDILGFTGYLALCALSKAGRLNKNRHAYAFFEITKNQFCRHWFIGALSQSSQFICQSSLTYTQEEFIQHMEAIWKKVQHHSAHNMAPDQNKYYDNAMQALAIIIKLSKLPNAELFLQRYNCYQMKELLPWLPVEIESIEEEYQGIQAFIDFLICAFENTSHFQAGADKITPVFFKVKALYDSIYPMQLKIQENNEKDTSSLLMHIFETRKYLLETYLHVADYQYLQKDEIESIFAGKKFKRVCFLRGDDPNKCRSIAVHHTYYFQFFEDSIFLLEKYAKHVMPRHVTAHACLVRIDIANKFFCASATEANDLIHQPIGGFFKELLMANDPLIAFLKPEDQKAFFGVLRNIRQDINKLFSASAASADLLEYAQEKIKSEYLIDTLNHVVEYKALYSMIVNFLDTVNPALDALQDTHSRSLIQLIDRLSVAECVEHKQALLSFFENLLLEHMKRFFMVALLKEDLDTLLPTLSKEHSTTFSETSIVSYYCMLKFEEYFLAKIEPSVTVESLEVVVHLSEQHVESKRQETLELEEPVTQKALASTSDARGLVEKSVRKQKKKGRSQKTGVANSTLGRVVNSELNSSPLSPRLIIRRGEKLDRIFKMLNEHGLSASYSKGGHTTFANSSGYKVTVPVHNAHLSHTVRRSIVERVNTMPKS